MISSILLLPKPPLTNHKDIFYKQSISTIKFIIRFLAFIYSILTYNAYSYQYYYMHSRSNNNNKMNNTGLGDNNIVDNIMETAEFGYVTIGIFCWYSWKYINDLFEAI